MLILRIALILLLTYSYVLAASPDQLSFADSLAAEGDHYRAITEYKRFIHYQPADPRAAYAQLQIARSLIAGERWLKADRALEKIWSDYPGSSHAEQARQLFAEVAYQRGDYAEAKDRFELLANRQLRRKRQRSSIAWDSPNYKATSRKRHDNISISCKNRLKANSTCLLNAT